MKIAIPRLYVGYGPVGHPKARTFDFGFDKEDLGSALYRYLTHNAGQGLVPTVFFDEWLGLEKQGYYILEVVNGEIPDAVLEGLEAPAWFAPRPLGEPGRKLREFEKLLPSYVRPADVETWVEGDPACDHDFGLESYETVERGDQFFDRMSCTRCGAVHAMPQVD
ncbi:MULTISPECIES: hypothetical protein [unclassified Variovorax]|uniref:hypothetical protein n=1 Tax=unclassified Variovorax TaxID=663243 RepID=UPI000CA3D5CE|nr:MULTISPECIES: hypothetical protein [unclassified Variovorax]ART90484.1 butyryl-CoA dehydrogenase [uncultured bacterium]VTU43086.1 hypothetical protein H6P1_00354 [Variovorax sp. PBL-H6]VTU43460.1 hypothetical protein SRS16P1_00551 [Variovorax sp. SRS16]VTU43522.1 hypothetical protein E5P1_00546 [Variovorax sp. PBL-E5]